MTKVLNQIKVLKQKSFAIINILELLQLIYGKPERGRGRERQPRNIARGLSDQAT